EITGNPFVMTYGERFLFVDLGAAESPLPHHQEGGYIDAQRAGRQIAVEIKDSPGGSTMDTTEKYREIVRHTILKYAQFQPSLRTHSARTGF
ncbi:MAG: hypothetical protein GY801_02155, partial [bacterium]|nr:hypothetical protein [bacterium]